jgi:hypothetical protein
MEIFLLKLAAKTDSAKITNNIGRALAVGGAFDESIIVLSQGCKKNNTLDDFFSVKEFAEVGLQNAARESKKTVDQLVADAHAAVALKNSARTAE